MRVRRRWLAAAWLALGLALWYGVFDLLITRGAKQYLLESAQHDAGRGPSPSMIQIMTRTQHDAWRAAAWFAVPVVAAGFATLWLGARREDERQGPGPRAERLIPCTP